MTTWKVKQEANNLFQSNKTPERYMEKFPSNVQVAKQKECGIWLDYGTITSELKIIKGSNITCDTATSVDIDKEREVLTRKMQAMVFIQNSSRQYNGLQSEMENNMSKRRDEYPTTVTLVYNIILEWHTEPGSMQGGSVFEQHNNQENGKRAAKIYKNITCYKYGQLRNYSGSCPFKEDKQEKLKDTGSNLYNIVQGINRATTGISSMHVNHKAEEINRET